MSGADLDHIKLLGFGLSRLLLDDEDITHNYGSIGYASPEQVTNQVLTPASDTWAVGVLTYIL
jgi:serine/threonine protein kinase